MTYSPEQRAVIIATVVDGLSKGTPLTLICDADGMPGYTTFWEWQQNDPDLSEAIARAREAGFDQIALDALAIADNTQHDTIATRDGDRPDTEWITRSRLRVETRLKLLAKWDPKRYGDLLKLGNPDGSKIDLAARISAAGQAVLKHGE